MRYLKEYKITGYIPNHGQYKNLREGFIYNAEKNQYECQRGNKAILPFKKIATSHDGSTMKVFRSSNKYCKDCPLRAECIGKIDFKAITESTDKPLYDEMHERLKKTKSETIENTANFNSGTYTGNLD